MNEKKPKRSPLGDDMFLGLRGGEFHLVYQPQLTIDGRTPVGVEALVRWRHPRLGAIGPNDFVHVAEREGLIEDLGAFVLRQACRDGLRWPNLMVSVNVSSLQFRNPNFAGAVKSIAAEEGFPLTRLELEILESAVIENFDQARKIVDDLRAAGVSIALDDFGTGYSSLSLLRRLPLDKVKIDTSFIAEIDSATSASIIQAVIALSRALGLKVVAEGVETPEQHNFLRASGCQYMQGFLFFRPVVTEAIDALVAKGSR